MFRRTRLRPTAVSIILLLTLVTLPTLIGVAQERLQLGGMTYSRAAAAPLSMPVTMSRAFFRGVGGVAFNAVAQGQAGLAVRALRYEASAPDGQRLVIDAQAVDGTRLTVRGHIYDWELLPTARFALDDNGLAVTLFGQLQDGEEANRVWETGGRVINYHRRLDNTLLGLRLLQADMLIIAPEAADLFRVGGRVLLGAGERGHDVTANRGRFATVAEWQELQDKAGNSYQSYVVGDLGQRVTFAAANGSIVFTGQPFWHAWRLKYRTAADEARRDELRTRLELLEAQRSRSVDGRLVATPASAAQANEIAGIRRQLSRLETIEGMPAYSQNLTAQIRRADGINPLVYGSVQTVMRYRALFKHYQARDRAGFAAFVESLHGVPVRPAVTTPTIQTGDPR